MGTVISTNDGKRYEKPGFGTQAGAVVIGSMAGSTIQQVGQPLSQGCMRAMKNLNKGADVVEIRNAVNKALEISGAKDKGVKFIEVSAKDAKPKFKFSFFKMPPKNQTTTEAAAETAEKVVKGGVKDFALKRALLQEMPEKFRKTSFGKMYASLIENMLKNGDNACYLPKANKCVANLEKLGTSAFHEIGHSINRNQSKFWRAMQKMRTPAMVLGSVIPMIGLFKRRKVEGEEPKNVVDKVTTFIKDHCGALTTLAFVPIVAEELKATARGNKLAKQLLKPDLYKKVVKSNRLGAVTYVAAGLLAGAGAFVMSKVRDMLSKPKEVKNA